MLKSLSPLETKNNYTSHIHKSNTKHREYAWHGNNGEPSEVLNTKNKDVCSATLILPSFGNQIATNTPYGNRFKRFRQINKPEQLSATSTYR